MGHKVTHIRNDMDTIQTPRCPTSGYLSTVYNQCQILTVEIDEMPKPTFESCPLIPGEMAGHGH